jgi:hypothetical protein
MRLSIAVSLQMLATLQTQAPVLIVQFELHDKLPRVK